MKKMNCMGKIMALALLVVMAVALLPAQQALAEGSYGYLVINNDTKNRVVNFRPAPGTSDYIDRLPEGLVMEMLGDTWKGSTLWYQVRDLKSGRAGYIHGDFFQVMDAGEVDAWLAAGGDLFPGYGSSTPIVPDTPVIPDEPVIPPVTGDQYIITVLGGVNVRKTPGGTVLTGPMSSKIPKGTILNYFEGPVWTTDEIYWVKVDFDGVVGYVRSDCFEHCDAYGTPVASPTPPPSSPITPPSSSAPDTSTQYGTVTTIKGGLNFRETPGGNVLYRIDRNREMPYYGIEAGDNYNWYLVYDEKTGEYGYLRHDFLKVNNNGGSTTPEPTYSGYVATSMDAVYVRSQPKTGASVVGKVPKTGTVILQTGVPVKDPDYKNRSWFPVQLSDGTRGYMRSDCVYALASWQVDYYNQYGVCPTPTAAPATPRPGNSDYLITTDSDLWVRSGPSKKYSPIPGDVQLDKNYVTKFYDTDKDGSVTWYKIKVNGTDGWVHGNFVRVLTNAEYDQWQGAQPTATPRPTATPLPDPSTFSDMAITTATKVKLRATPSMEGKELTMLYYQGTQLTYLKDYELDVSGDFYWFRVKYGTLSGWMHGDYVRVLTEEEKKMYELAGDPDAPPEASYRNLSLGSSGEDVTALQTALVEKGYLDASEVTGIYLSATEAAVRSFQKDNKLSVDGIAGEQTQHALFGTVPEGTYTGGSVTPVLYPAEMVDWWNGGIDELWSPGKNAIITDVKTGISFRAQRLYGDNHADAEPATTEDTAAICRIYGVNNPQEISDREKELQSYRRRPLWVTIGGRTFCGSMYGIPHNFDGDRIPDNGYNGQFCVHFTNSMTHGSTDNPAKVDVDSAKNGWYGHQTAIKDAYKAYYEQYGN